MSFLKLLLTIVFNLSIVAIVIAELRATWLVYQIAGFGFGMFHLGMSFCLTAILWVIAQLILIDMQ